MPEPSDYKDKKSFMSACIPMVLEDGAAKSQEQAVAMCSSMWDHRSSFPTEVVGNTNDVNDRAQHGALEDRSMGKQNEAELRQNELARVQRVASVDTDDGTFGMTLATEGEASDGHILSIEGARIPDRMPMLISHANEPTRTAGSVVRVRRHLSESPRRLTGVGMMELEGEGDAVSMRRDIMHMISKGHINAVSVRWDFDWKDAIPRTKLPEDHPHFVNADEEPYSSPKRGGFYFKRWTPRETSIVPLGADPLALIGRARETSGAVSAFWQRMAEEAEKHPNLDETTTSSQGVVVMPDLPSLVAAFGARVRELGIEVEHLMKLGAPFDELMRVFEENKPVAPMDETIVRLMQKIETLESRLSKAEMGRQSLEDRVRTAEYGRVGGDPADPASLSALVRQAVAEIRQDRRVRFEEFRRELAQKRGRVEEE